MQPEQCVTIYSTGRKFHPVLIFKELHSLTLVARSYGLLVGLLKMSRTSYLVIQTILADVTSHQIDFKV